MIMIQRRPRVRSRQQQQQAQQQSHNDRHVTFDETPKVNMVETISESERSAVWYTPQEFKEIMQNRQCDCEACSRHYRRKESGEDDDPHHHTIEKDAPTCLYAFSRDHKQQHDFVVALLDQQWEHKKLGIKDPKGLFQFSRSLSKFSKQRAREQGKMDAEEVKAFNMEKLENAINGALELLEDDFDAW